MRRQCLQHPPRQSPDGSVREGAHGSTRNLISTRVGENSSPWFGPLARKIVNRTVKGREIPVRPSMERGVVLGTTAARGTQVRDRRVREATGGPTSGAAWVGRATRTILRTAAQAMAEATVATGVEATSRPLAILWHSGCLRGYPPFLRVDVPAGDCSGISTRGTALRRSAPRATPPLLLRRGNAVRRFTNLPDTVAATPSKRQVKNAARNTRQKNWNDPHL